MTATAWEWQVKDCSPCRTRRRSTPTLANHSNGSSLSSSMPNRKVGGTGRSRRPAAWAACRSVKTGLLSPIALARKRRRPALMVMVTGGSCLPITFWSNGIGSVHLLVQRYHGGTAESDVVLQRERDSLDLAGPCLTAQ